MMATAMAEMDNRVDHRNGGEAASRGAADAGAGARPRTSGPAAKRASSIRRALSAASSWMEHFTAAKVLSICSLTVALALLLPFAADLLTGWPFHRASVLMDAAYTFCALVLGVLSWHIMREID